MFELKRTIFFEIEGHVVDGVLYIAEARWIEDKAKWGCGWSVSHIHPEIGMIYGRDPLDAFVVTLDFLACLIRGSELDGLPIWWKERGDHAGLVFNLCETRKWEKS